MESSILQESTQSLNKEDDWLALPSALIGYLGIREKTQGVLIGLERQGERISNPI